MLLSSVCWARSSVRIRAPALQAGGLGFESRRVHFLSKENMVLNKVLKGVHDEKLWPLWLDMKNSC